MVGLGLLEFQPLRQASVKCKLILLINMQASVDAINMQHETYPMLVLSWQQQ